MENNKSKYTSLSDWRSNNLKDYMSAYRQGFLKEICDYYGWTLKKHSRKVDWNDFNNCLENAKQYKTYWLWRKNSSRARKVSLKNNWVGEIRRLVWGDANFLPFEEARSFVHNLKLKSLKEWNSYSKSGKRPKNIPSSPRKIYMSCGYIGIADWLGYSETNTYMKRLNIISYEDAKTITSNLDIKTKKEYLNYLRQNETLLPVNPRKVYKHKGWINWYSFLGTTPITKFTYNEAKNFIQNLSIKNSTDYFKKVSKLDKRLPSNPRESYKDKGWINWDSFLGVEDDRRKFTYEEVKSIGKSNNIKNIKEWRLFVNKNKNMLLPKSLYDTFSEFTTNDFFGSKFLDFNKARELVHSLNLNSITAYSKISHKQLQLPTYPRGFYKEWVSWEDWIGAAFLGKRKSKYLPFEEARAIVWELNFKTWEEWEDYINSDNSPKNIPRKPEALYFQKGNKSKWIGRYDWIGTQKGLNINKIQKVSYEEAKKLAKDNNIKGAREWKALTKSYEYPCNPDRIYKEWVSWYDFLDISKK